MSKLVQCHRRECEEQFEWEPTLPTEIFVSMKIVKRHGWILFRGDPYCLLCGVQAMANFIEETSP